MSGVPQVFISYARPDKRRVGKLVEALRKSGFTPWWDDDIPPGAGWEETIERALAAADAVLVCWSPASVASENVRSEARRARSMGRLVQVFIGPCEPPLFFGERQGVDLEGWNGSVRSRQFERVVEALHAAVAVAAASTEAARPSPRRARRWRIAANGLAAAILLSLGSLWGWHAFTTPAHAAVKVAVVPLEGIGGGSSAIADGATDQVRASLDDAHIPTISSIDSENLRGGDVDAKLGRLGAAYTVSGTVEASGSTLHARLHLDDRLHHASLWSYEVDGPANDPVALDYRIGRAMAGVISCSYRGLGPGGLTDPDLISRYLRVCDLFVNENSATDPKATDEVLSDLRLITSKAPDFVPGHSDLAKFSAYLAPLMPPEQAARARAEAEREATEALKLDPHSSDAWLAREMILPPMQWARREALLRKGVAVNPNWPHTNGFMAEFLQETGRMREAATYAHRAAAADLQIDWTPVSAGIACSSGNATESIADLKQRLSSSPGDPTTKKVLRWCLDDVGDYRGEKALETPVPPGTISIEAYRQAVENALISKEPADRAKAQEIAARLENGPDSNAPFVQLNLIEFSSALGDLDRAFRLASSYSPGFPVTGQSFFLFEPQTESMRRDPRFFGLAKRIGLLDYWRSTGRWPDFCAGPDAPMPVCRKT
jgi:TolB-like protein/tetratricopeptide (TPR) repeat protein